MSDLPFDPDEKHQSQVPALQLLVALGFTPLSHTEALAQRGGRARNVLLADVLADQLLQLNGFTYRGKEYAFDLADAHEAIRKLTPAPERARGLQATSQEVYDVLLLGTTITKTIDGDTRSYSFRYVDWEHPERNVFHVTAEVNVERTGSTSTKRCDIVAYVNGIPFVVIENKGPTELVKKAESQLIGYQKPQNIPHLFNFAQLLMSMNRREAQYATVGTPGRFWSSWRDDDDADATVSAAANRPLTEAESAALFSGPLASAREYFDQLSAGERAISEQDRLIHALCRPERLLDLVRRFTVFDGGVRKIARHQQYFAVRSTLDRVAREGREGRRDGGVIWHTQGSGKSLTMVMLGKAIALDPRILDPRIVIVTDRDDLDKQIAATFRSCDLEPVRATSGAHLAELVRARTPLVTTIINKFENAAKRGALDESRDVFVLVDESHRSQTGRYGGYGQLHLTMRRMLPNACYLGFTGTPLLAREKSTLGTFGALIHRYTIDEAVRDGAVVPLLYEGRLVEQQVAENVIDSWFEKISEGLTAEQKRDLKRKFSRIDVLGTTGQAIRAKAFDISEHYRKTWQGTGLKAQLVAPSKAAALRFKEVLDEIGHVTSEVLISSPPEYEGEEEVDRDSMDLVRRFWDKQMAQFGGEAAYNARVIEAFKGSGNPEILIVVSKLLTGFDAPRNTVLYLCKSLREHTLLQAIARVNRLHEEEGVEKEFGIVIDYEGLLGELDKALTAYAALGGYDPEDLRGAVHDIRERIRMLPQLWADVWELFKTLPHQDMEALEQHLADDAVRQEFYARFAAFAKCLHISLSSDKLPELIDPNKVGRYREDWRRFAGLRRAVQLRYQEVVDLRDYEPKIRRLLDDHVTALPAEVIIAPLDITDSDALRAVVEESDVTAASKADRIAHATQRTISERMDEDPALYRRFSEMLQEALDEYRQRREAERYLLQVRNVAERVAGRDHGARVPELIRQDPDAAAVYGAFEGLLIDAADAGQPVVGDELAGIARDVVRMVLDHLIVGIWSNDVARNKLLNALDDYFWDELGGRRNIVMTGDVTDALQQHVLRIAEARFPR